MDIARLKKARQLIDEAIFSLENNSEPNPVLNIDNTITGRICNLNLHTSNNGTKIMPHTFYFHTDQIETDLPFGRHEDDIIQNIYNATFNLPWTGKDVDIVNFEAESEELLSAESNDHPDISGRFIPMDWPGWSGKHNNQTATGEGLEPHARGCLSVGSGAHCGFAKNAKLRAIYGENSSTWHKTIQTITDWHQSKTDNRPTIIQAPTGIRGMYKWAIKIDDIQYIQTPDKIIHRPVGGWKNLTPFVDNYLIPRKLQDPTTKQWFWVIACPNQEERVEYKKAIRKAVSAGIHFVSGGGNTGHVYAKDSDPISQTKLGLQSYARHYSINSSSGNFKIIPNTMYYGNSVLPLRAIDHSGVDEIISVGNFQSSDTHPLLDLTSSRGPGVDICACGYDTWSAYPAAEYADGWMWGQFGGVSGATGITAGILACLLEKVYTETGEWLSPKDAKSLLIQNSKKNFLTGKQETGWINPLGPQQSIKCYEIVPNDKQLLTIQDGERYKSFMSSLAGTSNRLIQYVR